MRVRTALVLGLLLVLGSAGCAKPDKDDGVATANGTAKPSASASASTRRDPQQDQEAMLAFAKCMREHGIPMDDPEVDGGGVSIMMPEGTEKAKVDAAQKECKKFMPNGGEPPKLDPAELEQQRKFAQCMRDNGVPKFPDPSEDGGGIMLNGDDLDPKSETFKKAETACSQYQPKRPGGAEEGPQTNTKTGGGA